MYDIHQYGRNFADIYDDLIPQDSFSPQAAKWLLSLVDKPQIDILELGVGTGRILLKIVEEMSSQGRSYNVLTGVDSSREMLEVCRAKVFGDKVDLIQSDIREPVESGPYDLVLCLCSTIGMSVDVGSEERVISSAAKNLKDGGVMVIETHNPAFLRKMLGNEMEGTWYVPYPGRRRGLVSFYENRAGVLYVDQVWINNGQAAFETEATRLTSHDEMIEIASSVASLNVLGTFSGLEGAPYTDDAPLYSLVLRKGEHSDRTRW